MLGGAVKEAPPPSKFNQILYNVGAGAREVGIGVGKGFGQTGVNILKLINPTSYEVPEYKEELTPTPGAQTAGWSLSKATELFAANPAMKAVTQSQTVAAMPKVLQNIIRGGMESANAGAVTGLQTGSIEQAKEASGVTAGFALAGAILGPAINRVGEKIKMSTIRPRMMDHIDNFNEETLRNLKLKGGLEKSLGQVKDKLAVLRAERNALGNASTTPVDVQKAFDSSLTELMDEINAGKHNIDEEQILNWFDKIQKRVQQKLQAGAQPDFEFAENLKEDVGRYGAWMYGHTDPDSKGLQKVANKLYGKLRQEIETASPDGTKLHSLNKQMQELIPIQNAMLARIPVEQRNRMLSVVDVLGILPGSGRNMADKLAMLALTRGQKSLKWGNRLANWQTPTETAAGIGKLGFLLKNRLMGNNE